MSRRNALLLVLAIGAASLGGWPLSAQGPAYDVLVRGGHVVDGTGNPWFVGDVAIKGGRIAAVGRLPNATAARVIDATGLVVAPGFIDLHTHSDNFMFSDGTAQSKIRQGVTLDMIGEAGSVAPRDSNPAAGRGGAGGGRGTIGPAWTNFTGYFAAAEKAGMSINVGSHVGYSTVRGLVMGYDTAAGNQAQLDQMKKLVARSMEEGAFGLVTMFESGGPDHPEEVIELAKIAASYGGNYESHIGSEGFQQEQELQFAIRVAKEAKIPVHIFHLKIRAKDNWGTIGKYLDMIERARKEGLDVTANEYPYTAMNHGWSAFFPVWAREGGKFAERLKDKEIRLKIKNDPDFKVWSKEHGGWEGIVMARSGSKENEKYEGMTVAQIAKLRGDADPADTCINLMNEDGGRISGVFHTMSEEDVRTVMVKPWVAIASDGSAINVDAPGVPHPRNYSTNVRVVGYYVRDQHLLTLEDAIRKMTSLPAQVLGLGDRGQIRQGFVGDVAIFDPATVGETNSFEKPKSYAKGVQYVLVNGVLVIDKGEHTGARPGKGILGPGYKAAKATSSGAQ